MCNDLSCVQHCLSLEKRMQDDCQLAKTFIFFAVPRIEVFKNQDMEESCIERH